MTNLRLHVIVAFTDQKIGMKIRKACLQQRSCGLAAGATHAPADIVDGCSRAMADEGAIPLNPFLALLRPEMG